MCRGFEIVNADHRTLPAEAVNLPIRGTRTSAGYDFVTTEDLVIEPQQKAKFKTDVKAYMKPDEVLLITVRSSMGIKNDLMISNTLGVIDSDFYENIDNDGNIVISLRNLKPAVESAGEYITVQDVEGKTHKILSMVDKTEVNTIFIERGTRIAQGVFVKFLESDNCNTGNERVGGVGSSGK